MRVLVTRPEADASGTAERLRARGHDALVAPLLRIEPTLAPAPEGTFDGVIVTSANAVPALARLRLHAPCPVFAVGRRTAASAEAAGLGDVRPARGDAEALSALIRGTLPQGSMLLHAAGRDRKPEPEASLRAAGYGVLVWEAYAALPVTRLPEALRAALAKGRCDVALHFSRRSAATLVELARDAGLLDATRTLAHGCLSDDVAAPLAAIGAKCFVAPHPDEALLLDLLSAFRMPHRSP